MKKRKMGLLKKVAFVVFAAYAVITLLYLTTQRNMKESEREVLHKQVQEQQLRNTALLESTDSEWTDERIAQTAREKFGLANPGETIIIDVSQK